MPRLISIVLLFLYTFSVSGITISNHYCGGKLRAIHIMKHDGDFHSKNCCKKGKMDDGCCEDKNFQLENKKHYTGSDKNFKVETSHSLIFQPEFCIIPFSSDRADNFQANYHSPPIHSPPVYLLNCIFLI